MDEFKRFFLRGLAAVLPTLLTIAIFLWIYSFINGYMGVHITKGMLKIMSLTGPPGPVNLDDALIYGEPIDQWLTLDELDEDERQYVGRRSTIEYKIIRNKALKSTNEVARRRAEKRRTEAMWQIAFNKYQLHLVGFLIAIIVVYFVGLLLTSFIGRSSWRLVERSLERVPIVKAIYPNVKQVTDFLFGEQKLEFSGVVAVPYPRIGVWSIGLMTGSPMRALHESTGEDLVTIFIPSSPTPITGYTITVPRREIIELSLSIDEALRFIISAGVIKPDTELLPAEGGAPA